MKNYFKCEICGKRLKTKLEGGYPNTCAECVPLDNEKTHTLGHKWYELKQLPNEYVIPPKMAQNEPISGIVEEAIKNTVDKIRTFITRYGEVGIRPNGDFEIIFSLPMFNEYLKKLENGDNESIYW